MAAVQLMKHHSQCMRDGKWRDESSTGWKHSTASGQMRWCWCTCERKMMQYHPVRII